MMRSTLVNTVATSYDSVALELLQQNAVDRMRSPNMFVILYLDFTGTILLALIDDLSEQFRQIQRRHRIATLSSRIVCGSLSETRDLKNTWVTVVVPLA